MLVVIVFLINTAGIIRYLFQWGDPDSSPGYDAVPTTFFIYWNILSAIVFFILLSKIKRVNIPFLMGYLYLLFVAVIVYISSESFYVHGAAKSLILNGLFFVALSSNAKFLSIGQFNKCLELIWFCIVIFFIFQFLGVLFFERYPSHSHPGYLVRYGSIYDDSLVLSIMLPMFSGYLLRKYKETASVISVFLLSLGLSWSSGSLTGLMIMAIYLAWCIRANPVFLLGYFCTIFLSVILAMDQLLAIFLFKSESINAHVGGWADVWNLTVPAFLGFKPTDHFPEPGYLSILMNFGVFVDIGLILLIGYLFRLCYVLLKDKSVDHEFQSFVGGLEGLLASVAIANLNFPVVIFPPIYFMLAVMSGVMFYHYSRRII